MEVADTGIQFLLSFLAETTFKSQHLYSCVRDHKRRTTDSSVKHWDDRVLHITHAYYFIPFNFRTGAIDKRGCFNITIFSKSGFCFILFNVTWLFKGSKNFTFTNPNL